MNLRFTRRHAAPALALSVLAAALLSAAAASATDSRLAARITSFSVRGTPTSPLFTVVGAGLAVPRANPKKSPSNQKLCPLTISGNAGFDYGTQLYVVAWDGSPTGTNAFMYAGGRYRPSLDELDCIGIVVLSHSPTRLTFTFGHGYVQYYGSKPRLLRNGDVVQVAVRGATAATVVHFG